METKSRREIFVKVTDFSCVSIAISKSRSEGSQLSFLCKRVQETEGALNDKCLQTKDQSMETFSVSGKAGIYWVCL